MNARARTAVASGLFLAIAIALLAPEPMLAGDDDSKAEKAIEALKGKFDRDPKAKGNPIVAVSFDGLANLMDADLKVLAGLKSLVVLKMRGDNRTDMKISDAGLIELAGLKSLKRLEIDFAPKVTSKGLEALAGLENLAVLALQNTKVTDEGLKHFSRMKGLTILALDYTQVTNAGLKELAGLQNLEYLSLDFTKVSDAGLKELAGLKKLRGVGLQGTGITSKSPGVAALKKALPECMISTDE